MNMKIVFAGLIAATLLGLQAKAQEAPPGAPADDTELSADRTTTILLSDRGNLPIPKNLRELKTLSLSFWIKFRGTNQQVYRFVNEAAQFHAYTQVCKRHKLNVSIEPILALSNRYIQAAIPAHYDEPEYELLEPLDKQQQQKFFEEMAGELYAFEFGYRVADQNRFIADSGKTKKVYCATVEDDFKPSYIALRATALRRLAEFDKPAETK